MTNPIIADNKPKQVTLNKSEEYYFCNCGRSKNQPFCDGSHTGSPFQPQPFTPEEEGESYLCMCKHTKNIPFCDGSHKQFSNEQVGKEGPAKSVDETSGPVAVPTPEEPKIMTNSP